jgi:ABC-2 type transport system permease protein
MRPIARANPVTAAVGLVRSLASGGPAALPLSQLACWAAGLIVVPGILAVRHWQASS